MWEQDRAEIRGLSRTQSTMGMNSRTQGSMGMSTRSQSTMGIDRLSPREAAKIQNLMRSGADIQAVQAAHAQSRRMKNPAAGVLLDSLAAPVYDLPPPATTQTPLRRPDKLSHSFASIGRGGSKSSKSSDSSDKHTRVARTQQRRKRRRRRGRGGRKGDGSGSGSGSDTSCSDSDSDQGRRRRRRRKKHEGGVVIRIVADTEGKARRNHGKRERRRTRGRRRRHHSSDSSSYSDDRNKHRPRRSRRRYSSKSDTDDGGVDSHARQWGGYDQMMKSINQRDDAARRIQRWFRSAKTRKRRLRRFLLMKQMPHLIIEQLLDEFIRVDFVPGLLLEVITGQEKKWKSTDLQTAIMSETYKEIEHEVMEFLCHQVIHSALNEMVDSVLYQAERVPRGVPLLSLLVDEIIQEVVEEKAPEIVGDSVSELVDLYLQDRESPAQAMTYDLLLHDVIQEECSSIMAEAVVEELANECIDEVVGGIAEDVAKETLEEMGTDLEADTALRNEQQLRAAAATVMDTILMQYLVWRAANKSELSTIHKHVTYLADKVLCDAMICIYSQVAERYARVTNNKLIRRAHWRITTATAFSALLAKCQKDGTTHVEAIEEQEQQRVKALKLELEEMDPVFKLSSTVSNDPTDLASLTRIFLRASSGQVLSRGGAHMQDEGEANDVIIVSQAEAGERAVWTLAPVVTAAVPAAAADPPLYYIQSQSDTGSRWLTAEMTGLVFSSGEADGGNRTWMLSKCEGSEGRHRIGWRCEDADAPHYLCVGPNGVPSVMQLPDEEKHPQSVTTWFEWKLEDASQQANVESSPT